jgi:hypothetical protein
MCAPGFWRRDPDLKKIPPSIASHRSKVESFDNETVAGKGFAAVKFSGTI